jgi:hypothetical protein
MKEFFKAFWLVCFGLNIGMFLFSVAFQQYSLAALNVLSAASFLVGYFIVKKNEDGEGSDE